LADQFIYVIRLPTPCRNKTEYAEVKQQTNGISPSCFPKSANYQRKHLISFKEAARRAGCSVAFDATVFEPDSRAFLFLVHYTAPTRWRRSPATGDNEHVKTLRLVVDPALLITADAQKTLERAAGILRAGGLVALPTETVYGLGANALDAEAVNRIFAAKQRPAWDPIIVHISDEAMLDGLVRELPEAARKLMNAFWPGPLTLLLPRTAAVPDAVTAGRPLVGVRMPAHPVALEVILRAGVPVAAPSANLFGHISPTTAAHVLADLDGRIDAVLDAGPTEHGVESTVLDPSQTPMMIYRPGAVTSDQIREIAGAVEIYRDGGAVSTKQREALPSPGLGLRHYAPRARLVLIEDDLAELAAWLAGAVQDLPEDQVGVMLPDGIQAPAGAAAIFAWGDWSAPEELARTLYAGLRRLDDQDCTVILCPLPPTEGIGAAIRDRLLKAGTRD
jgi:L-threonylcarbamoyladenylate synthase